MLFVRVRHTFTEMLLITTTPKEKRNILLNVATFLSAIMTIYSANVSKANVLKP